MQKDLNWSVQLDSPCSRKSFLARILELLSFVLINFVCSVGHFWIYLEWLEEEAIPSIHLNPLENSYL